MIEIIESREQITPSWLTETLVAAGLNATVLDVEVEPIIAGYYGSSSRLKPRYAQADDSLPRSLFLKMATEHQVARETAAQGGMYGYELGFYRQLAGWVNISTPRCYAAEIADDGATFVLLLEDAAPLKQPDQLLGLDPAKAGLAMQELAGLHASTWQGHGMENCDWANISAAMAEGLAAGMVQLQPLFLENFGADLSSADIEVLSRLTEKAHAYWRYTVECSNQASVHGDFRADNMLFGERDGKPAMVAIDWIGAVSSSGRDLGHFLGTSMMSEVRKAHEQALLSRYHETLCAHGVSDFSREQCIDDYRINLLYPVFVVVTATASVNVDTRGRELFLSMFKRSCEAIRDMNALELINNL